MSEDKEMLVDALCGFGFGRLDPTRCERMGLATFTGNQWNENWDWSRAALMNMTLLDLNVLYSMAKGREIVSSSPQPARGTAKQ